MYIELRTSDILHKKTCRIEPELCGTSGSLPGRQRAAQVGAVGASAAIRAGRHLRAVRARAAGRRLVGAGAPPRRNTGTRRRRTMGRAPSG
jgi:hypothetical protein